MFSGTVLGSPQLLYNIIGSTPAGTEHLFLRSSPFASTRPTIPTARAIVIARVASPFSTDRAYQNLFLHGLQDYFKKATRIVKQGDVIAVPISTVQVHRQGEAESGTEDASHEDWDDINELEYGFC